MGLRKGNVEERVGLVYIEREMDASVSARHQQ